MTKHVFGGGWTSDKLERLKKYLQAYTKIMAKHPYFKVAYIDAFAGTGYVNSSESESNSQLLLPEFKDESAERFIDGSARVALQVTPHFHKYIFIESKQAYCRDLQSLKEQFADRAKDINVIHGNASEEIKKLCAANWSSSRAVLFLDPYGMQVEWDLIQAIARTEAIDLWYLFPLGVGVNRLLTQSGEIDSAWAEKLDRLFGTRDWQNVFYKDSLQQDLFNHQGTKVKTANFSSISQFMVQRLKTVFPHVSPNPLQLYNSRGNPLYLLCFAAGNEKGGKTAVRIANSILGK